LAEKLIYIFVYKNFDSNQTHFNKYIHIKFVTLNKWFKAKSIISKF